MPPTSTATPTIPPGYAIVPQVTGMPYSEARQTLLENGFRIFYQDVLDLNAGPGVIIEQDPPAGSVSPLGEVVVLLRAFEALQMYAGGECIPLWMYSTDGTLLYWVELDEGVTYRFETNFDEGQTRISDYRMATQKVFDNDRKDHVDFRPLASGRYVISIGPYHISEDVLREAGGRLDGGCLWITPID